MAKTVEDPPKILGILQGARNYKSCLKSSFEGLRLGFVDPKLWKAADFVGESSEDYVKYAIAAMVLVISRIYDAEARIVQPISLVISGEATGKSKEDTDALMDEYSSCSETSNKQQAGPPCFWRP